ncbi:MAG: hypothetical protein PF568_06235 [Deltaproteobacteria bacterium]|jgi:flagellar basal body-associated protein FliL|nr:hypothetical protein [Deltaproteobacteria bacterium]
MKKEQKHVLIILAVVFSIVLAYVLSALFMQPQPKQADTDLQQPVNRLESIRDGFLKK